MMEIYETYLEAAVTLEAFQSDKRLLLRVLIKALLSSYLAFGKCTKMEDETTQVYHDLSHSADISYECFADKFKQMFPRWLIDQSRRILAN